MKLRAFILSALFVALSSVATSQVAMIPRIYDLDTQSLPTATPYYREGTAFLVIDAVSETSCTTGGGNYTNWCCSDGAGSWALCNASGLWTDGGATTYLTSTTDQLCVGCTTSTSTVKVNDAAAAEVVVHSTLSTGSSSFELGTGGTGSRYAYIDLTGDDTYTDYGLRIIRNNGGANTSSYFQHRGTGALAFYREEAGTYEFLDDTGAVNVTLHSDGEVEADYFEPNDALCYVYEAGGGQTIGTSWATMGIDTSVLCHSNFSFASDTITVTAAGYYMVDGTACADSSASSNRNTVLWRLTNSAGTEYAGTRRGSYHRIAANGEDCASWNVILNLGASGTVRIEGQSTASSTITTLADGVTLRLERVSD